MIKLLILLILLCACNSEDPRLSPLNNISMPEFFEVPIHTQGLGSSPVTLYFDGGKEIIITNNGLSTFSIPLIANTSFGASILIQPPDANCWIENPMGIATNPVAQISLMCSPVVGGSAVAIRMVSGENQTGIVGNQLALPLTARVEDAFGNPVAGVAVAFTVTAGGGAPSIASALSASDGTLAVNWTLGTAAGGVQNLEMSGMGLTPAIFSATAVHDVSSQLTMAGATSVSAAVCSAVTISRFDQYNNPASPAASLSVTLGGMGAGSFYTANDCSGVAVTSATIAANDSSTQIYFRSSDAAIYNLSADGTSHSQGTHSITVTAGAANIIKIASGNNQAGTVGKALANPIVAKVEDSSGNPISGVAVNFTVTAGGGTRTIVTGTSGADGLVSASWKVGTVAGAAQTLVLSSAGLTSATFSATAIHDISSQLTMSGPASVSAAVCSAIKISRLDHFNNPTSPGTILSVTLGGRGTGSFYAASGCSGTAITSVTIAASTSFAQIYFRSFDAASYNLTSDTTSHTQGTHTINVTAGAPAAATSTITGTSPVVANGVATSTVTITILDASSNPISGQTPTYTATGSENTYGACSATNTSGVSTCTLSSITAETKTLSIATPIVKADGSVVFTAGAAAVANSTISGSGPIVANGSSTSTVTITLLDANNNPVAGQTPTFSADGSNNTYGTCSPTNASGVSNCTLSSTTAEVKTLSIATPVVKTGGTVAFTAAVASRIAIVSGDAQTGTVGDQLSLPLAARVEDANGNPVAGFSVTITITAGGGSTSAGAVISAVDGTLSVNWTLGTVAGATQTLEMSGTSLTSAVYSATAIHDPATKLAMAGPTSMSAAVCSSAITISRMDQYNNPASPATALSIALGGMGTGSFYTVSDCSGAAVTSTTIAASVSSAQIYFKSSDAATYNLTADGTSHSQGILPLNITAGAATALIIVSGDNQSAPVNTALPSNVVAKVQDAYANPVSGVTVTMAVSAGGGTVTPVTGISGADGLVSASWTMGPTAGNNHNLTFSSGSLTSATFIATATPPPPVKLGLAGPTSVGAGICSGAITITLQDSNNALTTSLSNTSVTLGPAGSNGFFFEDSSCSGAAVSMTTILAGASSKAIYYKNILSGSYNLTADSSGLTQGSYTIMITGLSTVLALSSDNFSLSEAGVYTGTPITINRTTPGVVHSVYVKVEPLSANAEDVAITSFKVDFDTTATSISINPSNFTILPDGKIEGDEFFRIKLYNPTNMATLGSVSEAQINLLDSETTEDFFFVKPIYTVAENGGSVSGKIQRIYSSLAASVDISFLNGTALASTHYNSAPQTISFAAGETEASFSIPILDDGTAGNSKSFYIELKNPTSGFGLRPWSTAKVRILDDDDLVTCDSSIINALGGGIGTSADPYRICNLSQLNRVRNNLSAHYRLMADLDLDPALDSDLSTSGTQPFLPIASDFTGVFDGGERILKNFRYQLTDSSLINIGLFSRIGGSTTTEVRALNLTQAWISSNVAGVATGGIIGSTVTTIKGISDLAFSGGVFSSYRAGGVLGYAESDSLNPFLRNFSHGLVSSTSNAGGIFGGVYTQNVKAGLNYNYSVMNVIASGHLGGLSSGSFNSQHTGIYSSIQNSHSKGTLIGGVTSRIGGLVGEITLSTGSLAQISDSYSTSRIIGGFIAGGLVGLRFCHADAVCSLYSSKFGGEIHNNTTGLTSIGGLIGASDDNTALDISFSKFFGKIYSSGSDGRIGGLLGHFIIRKQNRTSSITFSDSIGLIKIMPGYSARTVGGLVGEIEIPGVADSTLAPQDNYFAIESSTFSGVLEHTGPNAGGFIGLLNDQGTSTVGENYYKVINSTSSGSVSGVDVVGGVIGKINGGASSTNTYVQIANTGSSGAVTGNDSVGGHIGLIHGMSKNLKVEITSTTTTREVTGRNYVGGSVGLSRLIYPGSSIIITGMSNTGMIQSTGFAAGGAIGGIACEDPTTAVPGVKSAIISKVKINLSIYGTNEVGGLVGLMRSTSNDCDVLMENNQTIGYFNGSTNVAGMIGLLDANSVGIFDLYHSYTRADISGSSAAGLFSKTTGSNLNVMNSYWLKDTNVNAVMVDDGNQRTTTELQTASTYVGWDTIVWNLASGTFAVLNL